MAGGSAVGTARRSSGDEAEGGVVAGGGDAEAAVQDQHVEAEEAGVGGRGGAPGVDAADARVVEALLGATAHKFEEPDMESIEVIQSLRCFKCHMFAYHDSHVGSHGICGYLCSACLRHV